MHANTMVFDGRIMITGSPNMTHNGFENNKENMFWIIEPTTISDWLLDFEIEWEEADRVDDNDIERMLATKQEKEDAKEEARREKAAAAAAAREKKRSANQKIGKSAKMLAPSQQARSSGDTAADEYATVNGGEHGNRASEAIVATGRVPSGHTASDTPGPPADIHFINRSLTDELIAARGADDETVLICPEESYLESIEDFGKDVSTKMKYG